MTKRSILTSANVVDQEVRRGTQVNQVLFEGLGDDKALVHVTGACRLHVEVCRCV